MAEMSIPPELSSGKAFVRARLTDKDREEIGEIIEHLMSVLDIADGDPDLEEDDHAEEDEHPYDALDLGEEDARDLDLLPIYAIDQSLGPVNENEEYRAYERNQSTKLDWGGFNPERVALAQRIGRA